MNLVLNAICDKTRFLLLEKISQGEICACKLPQYAKVSQPAVSQHLKILLDSKLVKMKKDGKKRLYSISKIGITILRDVSSWNKSI